MVGLGNRNNLLDTFGMSSVAFDNIVPLGQDFVLDDMPFTLPFKSPLKLVIGDISKNHKYYWIKCELT